MTPHRLLAAAFAVLVGCGQEPMLEADRLSQAATFDPEIVQDAQDAPTDPKHGEQLNGTAVALGGPTLDGCNLTESMTGAPVPEGCSNNGPFFASSLAWVGLDSITAPDGSAVSSVTLQGTRFSGSVNGVPVSGEAFVGMRFNGKATDGSVVQLRLDGAGPGSRDQADVWRYDFSYQNWKGEWKHLCKGGHDKAVVVVGRWDYHEGQPGDGAKVNDPTVFTIGCRHSAVERCINAGYKPWDTRGGVSLDEYHQACVRMLRADYCGDGVSHTTSGRHVNLYDRLGIVADDERWVREAEWTPAGARCLNTLNLTMTDAPCLPLLGTKTCGEATSFGTDTLLVSETPKAGGRDGHL